MYNLKIIVSDFYEEFQKLSHLDHVLGSTSEPEEVCLADRERRVLVRDSEKLK